MSSNNGVLRVSLRMQRSPDSNGHLQYCFLDERGNQAPTLRVQQGDTLIVTLKNEISVPAKSGQRKQFRNHSSRQQDPCTADHMVSFATNIHFHGLTIPPVCHQDETLRTTILPGNPPFEYRVQIPRDQPPGLYWYHPHVHGFTEEQVLGGASGALIVEGMERANPRVAGLPERLFVIRDENMPEASSAEKADPNRPTKQLSVNYVSVPYPNYPPAMVRMKPSEPEFWRVLNASADTYLDLRVEFNAKPQLLSVVALDGVPLRHDWSSPQDYAPQHYHLFLPPAGRAEFIIHGPPAGVTGVLLTAFVYRGASDENGTALPITKNQPGLRSGQDDVDPRRPLVTIRSSNDAPPAFSMMPTNINGPEKAVAPPLSSIRPVRKRSLYFSEKLQDPSDPNSPTLFFITEEGHTPAVFDPHAEPGITVRQGEVEDWVIENRSQEGHAFHVHQLHFLVVSARGVAWEEPALRDTIDLPAWDGLSRYPSVTVRMDFRNPHIVGTIPFHCHIMQHIDGGMMGTIRIVPETSH